MKIGPLFIFTGLLTSCLKEELPVPKHQPGEISEHTIEMNSDYRYQVYYDLESGRVVEKHLKSAWDLGFSCDGDKWVVRLNSAKSMLAAKTSFSDLSQVTDTAAGHNWKWDLSSGSDDSTAIGDIEYLKEVFLVDAGYDEKGQHQGVYKIRFDSVGDVNYYFTFSEMGSAMTSKVLIRKEPAVNQVLFSFKKGGKADVSEPAKTSWDIIFTQYTQLFEGNLSYIVAGALLNPYLTTAYVDSLSEFKSITLEKATVGLMSDRLDIPGYSWKSYIFATSSYQIHTFKNYVIKTQEGFYWKLRFTDFYNNAGQSGFPKFEFQKL